MIRILQLTLGGASLALAMVIAAELAFQVPNLAASPNPASPVTEIAAEASLSPDFDDLVATIRQRPLFTPGRRPLGKVMPAPTSVSEAGQSGITARLTGLMIQPGDRQALFARDGGKPFTAKPGDQVDGWTVASIEADGVVLTGPLGERTLHPADGAHPSAGMAAGHPPAPTPAPAPLRLSTADRVMKPPANAAAQGNGSNAAAFAVGRGSGPPVAGRPNVVPPSSTPGRPGVQ